MIVITAASGRLGKAVAGELASYVPAGQIRLAARSLDKLDDYKKRGFDVVKGDYDNPGTLEKAFEGADAVLLISSFGPNDLRIKHHASAIDAAKKAGVRHVVYTSTVNPHPSRFIWAGAHKDTEAYLKESGLAHTILRDNPYAANMDNVLAHALDKGTLSFPGVDAKVAYVTHKDIALAAAKVLTASNPGTQTFELTGSEALTGHEIADILSRETGKDIVCKDASSDDFAAMFRSLGFPDFVVDGLVSFYEASQAGEYAKVSGDIEAITGKSPSSMASYVKNFVRKR